MNAHAYKKNRRETPHNVKHIKWNIIRLLQTFERSESNFSRHSEMKQHTDNTFLYKLGKMAKENHLSLL